MALWQDIMARLRRQGPPAKPGGDGPDTKTTGSVEPNSASWQSILGYDYNPDDTKPEDYREMVERDPVVAAALNIRKVMRIAKGYRIEPGEGPRAENIAEEVRQALKNIEGTMLGLVTDLMDARVVGAAVIEKVPYVVEGGEYRGHYWFRKFAARWAEEFDYTLDEGGNLIAVYQHRNQGGKQEKVFTWDGKPDSRGKEPDGRIDDLILFRVGGERGNRYGRSALRPVLKAYRAKDHIQRMFNVYLERFAGGAIKYKLPESMWAKWIEKAKDLVRGHRGSPGVVIPAEHELDLVFPPTGGQGQYIDAINRYNAEILIGLGVPQTIMSGTGDSGSGGSLALSQTHMEALHLGLDHDGRMIEDTINEQVIAHIVAWNYGDVPYAEMPRFRFNEARDDDLTLRAEIFKAAQALGLALSRDQVRSTLGVDAPVDAEDDGDVLEPRPQPSGGFPEQLQMAEHPAYPPPPRTAFEEKLDLGGMEKGLEDLVEAAVNADTRQAAKLLEEVQRITEEVTGSNGNG